MLVLLAFAFIAGILTILAPCTLPVVPLVLGASATGGRRRSLGILVGFGGSFVIVTVVLASALASAGLTTAGLRTASALVLALVGLTLVIGRLERYVERGLAPLAQRGTGSVGRNPSDGFAGGILLGGGIGLLWAPCVGPIMAAVVTIAATHGPDPATVAVALAYVVGALVPLSLIERWGRRASDVMDRTARRTGLRRGFGSAMVVSAALIVSGLDITIESRVADALPQGWSGAIAAVEQQSGIQEEIHMLRPKTSGNPDATEQPVAAAARDLTTLPAPVGSTLPSEVVLDDLGPAPELTRIDAWINTDPLTIGSLRGKVILVEFWTFACINCIHVQPYVKAWYGRYASAGLIVVGVHTPELSFERDLANVRDAVAKADIRFPVAVDPSFATWNAYRNGYWPAFYFIDRAGEIRHVHVGEGDYDGSEQVIRELLTEGGS
jgi:cytochrome c biogenesis protein CcdA/thiol-disulfide isomerase/thioredoxin